MQENTRNQIIWVAALIILIGGVYLLVGEIAPSSENTETASATSSSASATTTEIAITGGTVGVTATGGYTIQEVPVERTPVQAPDYNAQITFSASSSLSQEQKTALEAQAAAMRAQLAADSSRLQVPTSTPSADYTAWLALGGFFQSAGDYEQAAKIWTYVSLNWPSDSTAHGNLGDLYMTYLRNYPKAEASYLAAIRNDPHQTNAYRNLLSLYTNMYKTGTTAAEDILKKGIKNNPDALDLYVGLAHYYRDHGRTAEARAAYDIAIAQAKRLADAANFGAVTDLEAEKAALQ